ncbi:hypothetical protein DICSQDRAFT_178383 [Dichomitus squalens LYAD-421 SS1]|uniref:uncharacterized protein n=1 Tax=Dichomitus squalens (strain LYAD-421) TaxID=732165 RepID=UPI0004412D8D|nr:uncharacterized protein DICSQDRAFT_178383 [Dichomitus squalens LYAD-421 SS1]EJF64807.1 hypothetical protein DICSQDRAFT_178383 [Dichomitus squalens LYAD-421 SS1]
MRTACHIFHLDTFDADVFVRDEYRRFIERLRDARKQKGLRAMAGCLLLGHVGIGKSHFLFYLLIECLTREETVLFTPADGDVYLFNKDGVARLDPNVDHFNLWDQTRIPELADEAPWVWSLVDRFGREKRPASHITYDVPHWQFFVAAPAVQGPDSAWFVRKAQIRRANCWEIPSWTDEELLALLQKVVRSSMLAPEQHARDSTSDAEAIQSIRPEVGRCPCAIFTWLVDPPACNLWYKYNLNPLPAFSKWTAYAQFWDLDENEGSAADCIAKPRDSIT